MAQRIKCLSAMRETWVQTPQSGRSPGEGNGNPLQYSCLENPIDRGAGQATVHGISESQTQLCNWLSLSLPTTTYMTQAVGYTPLPTLLFYPLLFEHIVWFRPDVEVMALQIMGCIRADGLSFHLWMSGTYFSAWHRVICWTNKCMLYTCYHLMFIFSNSFYDGNLYLWI